MNKKILFATLSIAALTACSTDDFESQNAAKETSPIQFEVINNQYEGLTRAYMEGNSIVWSAKDGDLFTLYHGATVGEESGFQNATYTANAVDGESATLTTPSMILEGGAIMVWPVDSTFRITSADALTITIPEVQTNIENNIPYVSDLVEIEGYDAAAPYNTAGLNRKYPVFMRPMASQLIVKADYAGTDATIAALYEGQEGVEEGEGIEPITVTSVELNSTTQPFTTEIPLVFNGTTGTGTGWSETNNNWSQVTEFGTTYPAQAAQLTAMDDCVTDNYSCKFLLLPQATISSSVTDASVVVNTIYGKVVVANPTYVSESKYDEGEYEDAWYRFIKKETTAETYEAKAKKAETEGDNKGKYKTTSDVIDGMMQTLNALSTATSSNEVIEDEPIGGAATRYVKVLLDHLDMSDLHIKSDKQLRDVARVWNKLGLDGVTVYLDGDDNGEFAISQKTIDIINGFNEDKDVADQFQVKPCQVADEECYTIVIIGGGNVQDLAFIEPNEGGYKANVAFNAGETWNWKGAVIVPTAGVNQIINRGTMANAEGSILQTFDDETTAAQNNITLVNDGKWNITAGTLNVQFDVINNDSVIIAKGAQYRQDGGEFTTTFTNEATTLPERFFTAAQIEAGLEEQIGFVENKGVFATVADGVINNYGLIEHADKDAKTYITTNQLGGDFSTAFDAATNKMGRINLPWDNKDEDNVSVSAELAQGFVSVTVNGEVDKNLNAGVLGNKVNYVIVNKGIETISAISSQVDYLEINQEGTEIAWAVTTDTDYTGLMVLSDVNIKLGTTVTATVTYLGKDMYVGGTFTTTSWNGYYGETEDNVAKQYITY